MQQTPGRIEAAWLQNLSGNMFGVAMTLLATGLIPYVQGPGSTLHDLWSRSARPLSSVVLSFAISAVFWVSEQRRLSRAPTVDGFALFLHLAFLLLIILVPVTTAIVIQHGITRDLSLAFSLHIALLAFLDLALWCRLNRRPFENSDAVSSAGLLAVFLVSILLSFYGQLWVRFVWNIGFLVPVPVVVPPLIERCKLRKVSKTSTTNISSGAVACSKETG